MTAAGLVRAHRRDVAQLLRFADADLAVVFADVNNGAATRNLLARVLPDLVAVYGSAAATLAADWYEEARDAARVAGPFRAVLADLPDRGRTDSLARWAVAPLFKADPDVGAARALVRGGLQRTIVDLDRYTVLRSVDADPQAVGWQRETTGKTCGFCSMLAGRGAVYRAESADFMAHDNCGCFASAVYATEVSSDIDLRSTADIDLTSV